MAKKKEYYIPTIEVVSLQGMPMMQMGDWSTHAKPAPPRRDPKF